MHSASLNGLKSFASGSTTRDQWHRSSLPFTRFTGSSATTKEGAGTGEGTWSYTGGTGKLKGLTGKGTYKSTLNAEGGEDHVEGEYTVPPPSPPKTKK